mgnify:CR=1 FL=1
MLLFIFRIVFFVFCIGVFSAFYNFATLARSVRQSLDDTSLLKKMAGLSEEELGFFDARINEIANSRQFNGQILIARNGNILFNRTFGYSDFRNAIPVTHNTQFQLASITKTFTATAVLLLHQQGILHIDSLVTAYIPEFPYNNITVRNLLNHTSGVQNYMWVMERYWNQGRLANNEDMLRTFIRLRRPLDFSPGTRFAYSNTGYAFLATIIERVSGQRFPEFMEQHIFAPLQMHNTLVLDPIRGGIPANRAMGFRTTRSGKAVFSQSPHDGVMGDKGIFSTAADLYKWDRAIASNQLLSGQFWNSAFDRAVLANQNTIEYGMGWRIQNFLDQRIIHHPGRWSGFRTSFKRFIDSDATLIILANNNMNISTMVHELQQVIFHREIANNPGIPLPAETEQEAAGSNMQ